MSVSSTLSCEFYFLLFKSSNFLNQWLLFFIRYNKKNECHFNNNACQSWFRVSSSMLCSNSVIENNSLFSMTELRVLFLHYRSFTVFTARARATKGALVRHHTWKYFDFYRGYVGLSAAWLRDWSSEAVPHIEDLSSSSSEFCKSRVTLILAFLCLSKWS